jgi:preprotein translocase subunit SecA
MLRKALKLIVGDPGERDMKRYREIVDEINALEPEIHDLKDQALRAKTGELKARLSQGETVDDLLPEAFAVVREASVRAVGLHPYDVQLIGGMVLHEGKIAEMKTGEGKTLVATLPLYLNSLTGEGAHLITPNDYLSKYGVQWMGPIYHLLGVSAAVIQNRGGNPNMHSFMFDPDYVSDDERYQHLRPISRREAYQADITYGTNNEFGFDYLRDNMAFSLAQQVQTQRSYAIVDEIDNILIDEARTPLIISGPAEQPSDYYKIFTGIVSKLKPSSPESVDLEDPDGDYVFDERTRNVTLTEQGIEQVEAKLRIIQRRRIEDQHRARVDEIKRRLEDFETRYHQDSKKNRAHWRELAEQERQHLENEKARFAEDMQQLEAIDESKIDRREGYLYRKEYSDLIPYLDNALHAHVAYQRDRHYVVQDGQVIIVDEFTGRLMHGRRYAEGLHQSIEAKEKVSIRRENLTMATITFQNFFRMYRKLAGMTGTAETEKEEFGKIYGLEVRVIPTHEPVVRDDADDLIFLNEKVKFDAAVQAIKAMQDAGRPVLVGTAAIETSERLSTLLERAGVKHAVLNAKQHEREATIIAQAGQPGAVTIATNMAGRGVDILLGGNPEGIAREKLRAQQLEITQATPEQWEAALAEAKAECEADKQKILELGGLHVLGTERHDARRIDNQLRGRAGRQGDPGSSQFYLSLEDNLMRRFGGERLKGIMDRISRLSGGEFDATEALTHRWISGIIAESQKRVEGYYFDIRKNVLEYDDVVNIQRSHIYADRQRILDADNLRDRILSLVGGEIKALIDAYLSSDPDFEPWDVDALHKEMMGLFPVPGNISPADWVDMTREEVTRQLVEAARTVYAEREQRFEETFGVAEAVAGDAPAELEAAASEEEVDEDAGEDEDEAVDVEDVEATPREPVIRGFERNVMLRILDDLWVKHLTSLAVLREGIGLQAYGNRNPLVEYQREAHAMWEELQQQIRRRVVQTIFNAEPTPPRQRQVNEHRAQLDAGPPEPLRTTEWDEVGRNDPCPCGSGKKFKHCHYREMQKQRQTVDQDTVKRRVKRRR